jgi:hypothetical protein
VALARNNSSAPVSGSTVKVSPRLEKPMRLPSGVQFANHSTSGVFVNCLVAPVLGFKIQRSSDEITAMRVPSGLIEASVSMPAMSARRLTRGTSIIFRSEWLALNKYQLPPKAWPLRAGE